MKNLKFSLIVLVVLGAGFIITKIFPNKQTPINTIVETPAPVIRDLCYIWNTEAGDNATLRMLIADGTKVTGSFKFLPAEKDSKVGHIEGIAGPVDPQMMARTANLWWTASGEGIINKEELTIIFGEGTANPGFGEMKDRGDGVYVYANPEKIDYSLNLQQTDCNDPAAQ